MAAKGSQSTGAQSSQSTGAKSSTSGAAKNSPSVLVEFVRAEFSELADADKAVEMAAYMKTDMPFYGVQKPDREPIYRELKKRFAPSSRADYEANVLALWKQPHREEKYAALDYAVRFDEFVTAESLPLYERLVREGGWWDFVDVIAQHLVGRALLKERATVRKVIEKFISDEDMWIRRTAVLAHNRHKKETDEKQLFAHCLKLAPEKEFFIRKAIGWALREYSYVEPQAVRKFIRINESEFSPLTCREALKRINK